MSYVKRAYHLVVKNPVIYAVPIVLGIIGYIAPVSPLNMAWSIFSGHISAALFWGILGFAASGATVGGYNAMVAAVARGEPAAPDTFLNNALRHYKAITTALAAVAIAYGLLGVILPGSLWFLFTPLFLAAGAFTHVWLASVVIGGMGALGALTSALGLIRGRFAVLGPILGLAIAADFVVPQLFYLVFSRSGMFWQTTVGMLMSFLLMMITTALGVVFRVAVFSAYLEEVGLPADKQQA